MSVRIERVHSYEFGSMLRLEDDQNPDAWIQSNRFTEVRA